MKEKVIPALVATTLAMGSTDAGVPKNIDTRKATGGVDVESVYESVDKKFSGLLDENNNNDKEILQSFGKYEVEHQNDLLKIVKMKKVLRSFIPKKVSDNWNHEVEKLLTEDESKNLVGGLNKSFELVDNDVENWSQFLFSKNKNGSYVLNYNNGEVKFPETEDELLKAINKYYIERSEIIRLKQVSLENRFKQIEKILTKNGEKYNKENCTTSSNDCFNLSFHKKFPNPRDEK